MSSSQPRVETEAKSPRVWLEHAVIGLVGVLCALLFWDYVKDDTYISFRYARNLIAGDGFVFNPGERVEGYTNFLWVLWSAVPHGLGQGGDVALWWARLLALLSVVALGWSTHSLTRRLTPERDLAANWLARVAALAVVCHPTIGIYAMSGLETVFFVALCTGCIERTLADRPRAAAWLAAMACLTRPEGHLFALVALGIFVWRRRAQSLRGLVSLVWAPMLVVVIYHVWRVLYFGEIWPNTHHVKNGQGDFLYAGVQDLVAAYDITAFRVVTITALFAALLIRQVRVVGCVLLALFFPLYLVWAGGDEMHYGRLLLPGLPLLAAVAAVGLAAVVRRLAGSAKAFNRTRILGVVLCLGIAAMVTPDLWTLRQDLKGWHDGMKGAQGALAMDLTRAVPSDGQVVYQDMGYCPYTAAGVRFFDTVGLVNAPLTQLRRQEGVLMQGVRPRAGEDSGAVYQRYRTGVRDMVFDLRPDAIVFVVAVQNVDGSIPTAVLTALSEYLERGTSFGFSAGLQRDPRLTENYQFFRAYERTPGVHLVALLRKDRLP